MLQTILNLANSTWASLKEHGGKYATIAVAASFALFCGLHRIGKEVHRNELIGASLLHLAPGIVRLPANTARGDGIARNSAAAAAAEPHYVPPEGSVTITPKDHTKTLDQVVNVKYNTWGLTFEPGLDLSVAPFGIGMDFKWFYFHKFGTELGLMYFHSGTVEGFSPCASFSHRLDYYRLLKNTEFVVSYAPNSPVLAWTGIRINF